MGVNINSVDICVCVYTAELSKLYVFMCFRILLKL